MKKYAQLKHIIIIIIQIYSFIFRAVKSDGPMESPIGGKILGRKDKKQK